VRNTMTGNRGLIKFDGQTIALIQNIRVSDNSNQQSVDGIGDIETQEWVPGLQQYNISGDRYFGAAQDLQKIGIVPGSTAILTAPEFEVEIQDNVTFKTLEHYTGCKFNTHERQYAKHVVSSESFSIVARHKAV